MKVLLIQPFGRESNTNYPPMGLLYLASYLKANTNYEIKILDLRANKIPIEGKITEIKSWRPDVVGITGLSIEWTGFKQVTNAVRDALGEETVIVAGGPHATIFKNMVLKRTPVKYVVKGEGEETFMELLHAIEKSEKIENIKGLVIRKNGGEIVETQDRESIKDLDSIPFPEYELLSMEDYFKNPHFHGNLNKYNRVLPILTSRGCPFRCNFCFHAMGYKFRARSAENVLGEIDWLVNRYGVKELQIEDDTFNFNIQRAKEIMKRIIQNNYRLSFVFPSGIKFELVDEELMTLFKQAGVYRIHYGIETAVPRVQKIVNKPINLERLNSVIELTDRANISSHGFFMMGFPTETEEEIMQTIIYATQSRLATANFSILKTFPGTPFGDRYLKGEQSFDDDFAFSYDSTSTNFSAVPDVRLKQLQKMAMKRFYLRPDRIWRIFRTSPNKKNLFTRNLLAVLSLIFRGRAKY
ncbi:MAG: B12-binding domain-containing radical SAM protein [Nitrospirae bacterium]|nr:B12-binding domain-containing radical SAM protein [Nitrospirota bacterium]